MDQYGRNVKDNQDEFDKLVNELRLLYNRKVITVHALKQFIAGEQKDPLNARDALKLALDVSLDVANPKDKARMLKYVIKVTRNGKYLKHIFQAWRSSERDSDASWFAFSAHLDCDKEEKAIEIVSLIPGDRARSRGWLALFKKTRNPAYLERIKSIFPELSGKLRAITLYNIAEATGKRDDFEVAEKALSEQVVMVNEGGKETEYLKLYRLKSLIVLGDVEKARNLLHTFVSAKERFLAQLALIEATRDRNDLAGLLSDPYLENLKTAEVWEKIIALCIEYDEIERVRRFAHESESLRKRCFILSILATELKEGEGDFYEAQLTYNEIVTKKLTREVFDIPSRLQFIRALLRREEYQEAKLAADNIHPDHARCQGYLLIYQSFLEGRRS